MLSKVRRWWRLGWTTHALCRFWWFTLEPSLAVERETTLDQPEYGYCSWLLRRGKRLFKAESDRGNEGDKLACVEREAGNGAQPKEGSCARELERSRTKSGWSNHRYRRLSLVKFSIEGNTSVERSTVASSLVWRRRRNSRVRDDGEKREKSFFSIFIFELQSTLRLGMAIVF